MNPSGLWALPGFSVRRLLLAVSLFPVPIAFLSPDYRLLAIVLGTYVAALSLFVSKQHVIPIARLFGSCILCTFQLGVLSGLLSSRRHYVHGSTSGLFLLASLGTLVGLCFGYFWVQEYYAHLQQKDQSKFATRQSNRFNWTRRVARILSFLTALFLLLALLSAL